MNTHSSRKGLFKTSCFFWDYGFTRTVRFSVLKSPYLVTLARLDSCSELSSFAAGEPIGLAVFKDREQDISSQVAYVYAFCQAQRVVVVQDDQSQALEELQQFLSQDSGHEFATDSATAKLILSRAAVAMSINEQPPTTGAGKMRSLGKVNMKCRGRLEIMHVLTAALRAVCFEGASRASTMKAEENNDEQARDTDGEDVEEEENIDWL